MGVDITSKLKKHRNKQLGGKAILNMVKAYLDEDLKHDTQIHNTLEKGSKNETNTFDLDLLDSDRIFHIDSIKKICITYRLRFLDSSLFKGDYPYEAIKEIKRLEVKHNIKLHGFKIVAPSKLFKLENYDDPLLFAPIGNGYYFLIHHWGNELNKWRKWLMLPFKNLDTLIVSALLTTLLLTLCVPWSVYDSGKETSQFLLVFFFMFKIVGFIIIFFGISRGKNFNSAIWNSKYFNH
ncbi:hypothetical protein [Mangrovimonas aestuarii]|uniref:hypothetical protein n=1 Tax=Mangrovimonas aestuarii TaxID=3018443 RepID=UPI002379B4C7|nr:hypothetical protein [Mangrovimonas aestuarii]